MSKYMLSALFLTLLSSLFSVNYDRDKFRFTDDDEIFIHKARTRISIRLDEGNSERIREIVRLISERFNGDLDVAFSSLDLFVIGAECDSLKLLLTPKIIITGNNNGGGVQGSYYDSFDPLSHKSSELMRENIEIYSRKIRQSEFTQEEIDFTLLILDHDNRRDNYASIDSTNARCEKFFENHPESIYERYIREFMRYEIAPHDWGTGASVYATYTQGYYKFDDYFKDIKSFQLNLYFTHKNFVTNLLFKEDILRSSKAFTRNDYNKNTKFRQYTAGLQFGNRIRSLQKLSFEPHIFVGASSIENERKDDSKSFLSFSPATGIGFSIYCVIFRNDYSNMNIFNDKNNAYSNGSIYAALTFDYFNPLYNIKYDNYNGGTLSISVGLGMYTREDGRLY